MVTGSSALYGNVTRNSKFGYGIGTLPYYPDVPGAPQNTVIGGASLWVMSGKKPEEYKGVAQFFAYLSQPEVAAKSHQRTGYLPVTKAAFELTDKSGFYKKNPGTDVSVTQMIRKTTDKSRGVRLGNFVQIRTIIDEELEGVWGGKKSAKEALDTAVKRGNEQLERFQKGQQALAADCAADGGHPGVLLLAGRAGAVPERAATGRVWDHCEFRGAGELQACFQDPTYLASFKTTAVFSLLVAVAWALSIALLLAVMANRVVRGRTGLQDAPDLALCRGARWWRACCG
jgi:hypothetical protein